MAEDVASALVVPCVCTACGGPIFSVPEHVHDAACLDCARERSGCDWTPQEPIGEWHPTVGYPREIPLLPAAPVRESPWRWACVRCRMNGPADNAEHAIALGRTHDAYACPATTPRRPEPRPPVSSREARDRAEHPDEYALRVGRRADLTRRYPDQAPAWTGIRP